MKETEAQERARRKAAKERVKAWWDDPATKPTPADNEQTRTDDISNPAAQEPNEITEDEGPADPAYEEGEDQ